MPSPSKEELLFVMFVRDFHFMRKMFCKNVLSFLYMGRNKER